MEKGKRNKDEFTCPICMYIMIQPVTMPCKHSLCMICYKQCVEKASLTCPICRLRIAVWARKNAKTNTLINTHMWEVIQRLFPLELKNQIDGNDSECPEDDWDSPSRIETEIRRFKQLSEPGEIRQEYEAALAKLERQREEEARKEEEASAALIKALKEEEEEELAKFMKERQEHERIGRLTAEQLKQTEETERAFKRVKESKKGSKESLSKATSKQKRCASSCLKLDDFYASARKSSSSAPPFSELATTLTGSQEAISDGEGLQNDYSPYPFHCISPSNKPMVSPNVPSEVASQRSRETLRPSSAHSHDAASTEKTDHSLEMDGGSVAVLRENVEHFVESDDHDLNDEVSEDPLSGFRKSDTTGHSFQPISSMLRTPPKKLPSGEVVDPELIRTIPRNLGFEFLSKKSSSSPSTSSCSSEIFSDQNYCFQTLKDNTVLGPIQTTNLAEPEECHQIIASSSTDINDSSTQAKSDSSTQAKSREDDYLDKIMLTKKIVYGKCTSTKGQHISSSYSCTSITQSSSAFLSSVSLMSSQNKIQPSTVSLYSGFASYIAPQATSSSSRCINNNNLKDSTCKDDNITGDFFITDDTELLIPLETDIKSAPVLEYADKSSSPDGHHSSRSKDLSRDEESVPSFRTSLGLHDKNHKTTCLAVGSEKLKLTTSKRPSLSKTVQKKNFLSKSFNSAPSLSLRDWCKAGKRKQISDEFEDSSDESIAFKKPVSQEEADRLFALQLQKSFFEQEKRGIQVDRFEGSSNEYSLRKKRRL